MNKQSRNTRAEQFFTAITARPKIIMVTALLLILAAAAFIPTLVKDTRSDAFMPPDHPALVYQHKSEEIFGLKDPMVIAITSDQPAGVFTPQSLALVEKLTEQIKNINNIDADRVTSLSTENDIIGTEDGMQVKAFFEQPPERSGRYAAGRPPPRRRILPLQMGQHLTLWLFGRWLPRRPPHHRFRSKSYRPCTPLLKPA